MWVALLLILITLPVHHTAAADLWLAAAALAIVAIAMPMLAIKMSRTGRAIRSTTPLDPSDPKAVVLAVTRKIKRRKRREYLASKERGLPKKQQKK